LLTRWPPASTRVMLSKRAGVRINLVDPAIASRLRKDYPTTPPRVNILLDLPYLSSRNQVSRPDPKVKTLLHQLHISWATPEHPACSFPKSRPFRQVPVPVLQIARHVDQVSLSCQRGLDLSLSWLLTTMPCRVRTLTGKEIELDIESDYKVPPSTAIPTEPSATRAQILSA